MLESEVKDVVTGKRLSMHIDSTGRPASPVPARSSASAQQTSPSAAELYKPSAVHVLSTPERAPANRAANSGAPINTSSEQNSEHHSNSTPSATIPTLLTTSSPAAHTPSTTHPTPSTPSALTPAPARATSPGRSHPMRMPNLSSMLGRSPSRTEPPPGSSGAPTGTTADGPSAAPADLSEKAKLIGALRAQKLTITRPNATPPHNSLAFPAVEAVPVVPVVPVARVLPSLTIVPTVEQASLPLLSPPQQLSSPTNAMSAAVSPRRLHSAPVVNIALRVVAKEVGPADKVLDIAQQYPVEVALAIIAVIVCILLDLWSAWRYAVVPLLMYIFVVHVL